MKIYIIHSDILNNRIQYINSTIQKLKECFSENIDITVINSPELSKEETRFKIKLEKTGDENFDKYLTNINPYQASNIEKHRKIWNELSDTDIAWIIEDDSIISTDYIQNVKEFVSTNFNSLIFDMIMTGFSVNNSNTPFAETHQDHTILPSKASYIIKGKSAKKLSEYCSVYRYPLRIMLSKYIQYNYKIFKCLCYHKHLLLEGSKIGIVPSSMNANNMLIFNPDYVKLIRMINNNDIDLKEVKNIYNNKLNHLQSADVNHIMGVIYHKKEKYDESKEYFNKAIDILVEKKGYLGKNSEILNNTINVYQYEQG